MKPLEEEYALKVTKIGQQWCAPKKGAEREWSKGEGKKKQEKEGERKQKKRKERRKDRFYKYWESRIKMLRTPGIQEERFIKCDCKV